MNQFYALLTFCLCFFFHSMAGQDIRFSFQVETTSATTTDVKVFAQTTSGTENMAGYTIYFYYNNVESTVTGFDSTPTTVGLGWGSGNETNILFDPVPNVNVGIAHTGYFFYPL